MSKTFYSEFVNHCMRHYVNYPDINGCVLSDAEIKNWLSCNMVVKSLSDTDREIIMTVYRQSNNLTEDMASSGTTMRDAACKASLRHGIPVTQVWRLIRRLSENIARTRGLI